MVHNQTSEKLVNVLCAKTQNSNPLFFRVLVGHYLCMVASMMRTTINTHDRGEIPVNMYALNLSTSGSGKGHSTNIIENSVIHLFRRKFLEETFPILADQNLPLLAQKRAIKNNTSVDDEETKVRKEFDSLGALAFNFDSATPPAVKQLRHKLLMANAGALSLQIDEIGSNLLGSVDVLTTFLELYDVGAIKQKLTKNTAESVRSEEIVGRTPTNMLLFGTPAKLLDGGKNEEELYSMLETGYARRCFFGYTSSASKQLNQTPEEIYQQLTDTSNNQTLDDLADTLENLADIINANKKLIMSKETSLELISYKLMCERAAEEFSDHEEIKKAELSHRYFKALKLAGAYAFVENSPELTMDHLHSAIKLAEESGESFDRLMTRDRPYVKLAKFIGSSRVELTQADLVDELPFYKGSVPAKNEMMNLATAWGYRNNIIIKKSFQDGIELLRGETIKETNLDEMIVSYGEDLAKDYLNEQIPFSRLDTLTQAQGFHWVNHHLLNGYRKEETCIPGFNMVVLDIDGGVNISTAKLLMKQYKFHLYTTKSHSDSEHCFRMVLPTSHILRLDAKDYKEFMNNVMDWLPFKVDEQTNQRARKWLSHTGHFDYNEGEVFDVLPFIPKTTKNEERKVLLNSQQSLDALERWVLNNIGDGRNNSLLRYALVLVDTGFGFDQIRNKVLELNSKIPDSLDEAEVMGTIMVTVSKHITK